MHNSMKDLSLSPINKINVSYTYKAQRLKRIDEYLFPHSHNKSSEQSPRLKP